MDEQGACAAVRLCPAEEMIWSKVDDHERERYDGADVAHLFRHCTPAELGAPAAAVRAEWSVLLGQPHSVWLHFREKRRLIPSAVIKELLNRCRRARRADALQQGLFKGTLLSRVQYLWISMSGLSRRLAPEAARRDDRGSLRLWTAAIDTDGL